MSVRVLVIWTSLARSSEGGYAFASGLTHALASNCDLKLILVVPRGLGPGRDLHEAGDAINVRPLTGALRIFRDLLLIHRWARRAKADVVLVPHEWASWAGQTPVVNVIQNVLYLHPEGKRLHPLKSRFMASIARATAKRVSGSIAVSHSAASLWHRETGLNSVVLPEGIDPKFKPPAVAKTPRSVVIVTGPFAHKNPELANDVCVSLSLHSSATSVTVIGLPEPRHSHGSWISSVSHTQMAELFGRAEVVLVPSSIESFGLPAFEARASGCAVLVGERTPMADWLRDDDQVTVVPGWDAEAWSVAALASLADPPDERRSNSAYSWAAVGEQWARTLSRMAAPPQSRRGRG